MFNPSEARPVLLLICSLASIGSIRAQSVKDILHTYYSKVSPDSSLEKWKEIKSLYAESQGYFSATTFQGLDSAELAPGTISYSQLFREWPDKQKEILYDDSLHTILRMKTYFLKNRRVAFIGNLPAMEGSTSPWHFFNFFPLNVSEAVKKSGDPTYLGIVKLPGVSTPCHEISFKPRENFDIERLYFNINTGLLESILFFGVNQSCIISRYMNIQGYLIPTLITHLQNGKMYSWTRYRKIQLNPTFSAGEFRLD